MSVGKTAVVSLLMLLAACFVKHFRHSIDVKPIKPLTSFPKQIGLWAGTQEYFSENVHKALGVDDYFLGVYRSGDGYQIELYVGFYESQTFGNQIHSPKNCMPGAGWNILGNSIERIEVEGGKNESVETTGLVLEKDGQRHLMIYWFESGGRSIASEYVQRIHIAVDSIFRRRTDGTLVRLIAPVPDQQDGEARTLAYLKGFSGLIIPILHEYLPSADSFPGELHHGGSPEPLSADGSQS